MKIIFRVLLVASVFFSCQKEVSVDLGQQGGTAVYTFSGSPDACTVATPAGTYMVGVALSAVNTVSIEVNVTTIGTYNISTSTVNGYKFSASGTFAATGVQTISLVGSGTPAAAQTNTFTPASSGITGCTFNITVVAASPAVYTLTGAPGACTSATINGTYTTGIILSASNTVAVQVNVSSVGSYNISTTSAGGISFSKSGNFTTTGNQTVILNGSGTPNTPGANTFTVGTAGCTFSVPVIGPATYTLSGSPGACTVATVNGTYTQGVALSATTNTVTVEVNVSATGGYTISTAAGGMTFSKSGNFTTTGVQNVILEGSGTPTVPGVNTFTVGTSGCTFTITVVAGPSGTYSCKIDGVFSSFAFSAGAELMDDTFNPPIPYFYLDGYTGPFGGGPINQFQIFISKINSSAVGPGTYNGNGFTGLNGYRIEIDYTVENPDGSTVIWNTSSTIIPPPNPPFTIVVTSVTATRVKGTFSGSLTNPFQGSTQTKVVTEGVFDLPVL